MSYGKLLPPLLSCALAIARATADEFTDKLKESAMKEIEQLETEALFNEVELSKKYIAALEVLEAKLMKEGSLDPIVRLREEKESVAKTGDTTAHADPALVELRGKYLNARKTIRAEVDEARKKASDETGKRLKEREALLVKEGKVEEALGLRKDGEALLAELASGMTPQEQETFSDPREGVVSALKPVTIPQGDPPVVEKPFAKGGWLESATMPAVRQRIGSPVWIGNRGKGKWPLIVVPKGTSWAASRNTEIIHLSAGNIVATRASFENMTLLADLGSHYYFQYCTLEGCGFGKTGTWYGWDQAAKFYFENCLVMKRFSMGSNVVDHGFRAQFSVFEKIEMPAIDYRGREPVSLLNHPWMKFANCRFVECRIPSSFALLTRECLFEGCTFVDDPNLNTVRKPIEVTVYLDEACKWNISKLPENVVIQKKTRAEAGGFSIPNAVSLRQKMVQ